jgi:hypothetical protein
VRDEGHLSFINPLLTLEVELSNFLTVNCTLFHVPGTKDAQVCGMSDSDDDYQLPTFWSSSTYESDSTCDKIRI